ncbi:hypothetical protein [Marinobacter salexigens]|uniref:hypothetical protein n=1 Tax=Marinobacter salexigens TaxID=1925763 RepID=UPI000C28CB43|nr:hypothetical protein [Marinobacter salexigens]
MDQDELESQLEKQIQYLVRSAEAFDAGHQDEAPRIATTIRILLHESRRSRSLLGLLRVRGKIQILSTSTFDFKTDKTYGTCTLTGFETDSQGMRVVPQYDRVARSRPMPAHQWWNEVIFRMPQMDKYTRRDFVLFCANKDGGAHVDSHPEKFKRIKDGNINFTGKKDGEEFKFTNILECAVRQMAYEILNSPDVQALVHS